MSKPRELQELLCECRACLYMARRHVTSKAGTKFIADAIKGIETHPAMIRYFNEAFGVRLRSRASRLLGGESK